MSGFEVVRVVLAAFPLLMSVLEQYKAVNRKRVYFRHRSLHMETLINALAERKILIESDLEFMLRAVDRGDDLVGGMEVSQYVSVLSDECLTQEFESLLGDRSQPYLKTLGRCERTLIEIATSLSSFKQGPWVCVARALSLLIAALRGLARII